TGLPKKIIISKKKMQISALATIQKLNLENEKNFLICLSTDYIAGKMMLIRAIEAQAFATIASPKQHIWQEIDTFYFGAIVPVQLKSLLDNEDIWQKFDKIKALIVGGASIPSEWKKQIERLPMPVYATFGMTETVSHIALQLLNTQKKQDYFEVLEHIHIQKNDKNCLEIQSILTDNQWITTNDVVEIVAKHQFKWLGRADNIINIGGKKIQPETIENLIRLHLIDFFENEEFFIGGMNDEKWGQKLVIYIETKNNWTTTKMNLFFEKMSKILPHTEIPSKIIFQEFFERTQTGKIKRL
ncbi:MAG: hypothetical protein EAZ20_16130, partial [Bacteroidetes bacterium]